MTYIFDKGLRDDDGGWDTWPYIEDNRGRELFVFYMDEEDVASVRYYPVRHPSVAVDYMGFYDTLRACEVFQL